MRFKWEVIFTCACGAILGALFGCMAGALLLIPASGFLTGSDVALTIVGPLLVGGCSLAGATIGGLYCLFLIRRSPDEWISPAFNKQYCTACQYDLTHNTTGDCPECGKPITNEQKSFIEDRVESLSV